MSNSYISILNRMKDRIENEADKREGTWTADNLQAVANELARIYSEDIDTILPQAFVLTASGSNLDACCSDYGIIRREATAAEVIVDVTGDPGNYYGVMLYAGDLAFMVPESFMIPESGVTSVRAVCSIAGEIGNVSAATISLAGTNRITKVINQEAAFGGYDKESDDSLRERTLEHIRTPANSGNIAHYKQWALEIPGVDKVRVYDLARGAGTVDVVLVADDNKPAVQSLLDEVSDHIESVRPVGADVFVSSGIPLEIKIVAEVIVKQGYTNEAIQNSLFELLQKYCSEVTFQSSLISYLGIVNILFDCPGVIDVSRFTLNGEQSSILLNNRQFPVAMIPEISVSREESLAITTAGGDS